MASVIVQLRSIRLRNQCRSEQISLYHRSYRDTDLLYHGDESALGLLREISDPTNKYTSFIKSRPLARI